MILFLLLSFITIAFPVQAQGEDADLAQELSNPLADLITIPIQINYDRDIGPMDDGWRLQANIQPVIPFHLNDNWNLITRSIIPVIYQDDILPGSGSDCGLGDINVSLFFSPSRPTSSGLMLGAGPILVFPSATETYLGGEKWGAGPAAVALTVRGKWTMGTLANHIWSYAGDSARQDISNTFVQPFLAYTLPSAWTFSLQSKSSYNWETEKWSVPINAAVSKLVRWGRLPVSLQAGVGYWVESPDSGPEGFRVRFQVNFVLPKPK
ncbi:MAG: transporter [Desulfobacter sp.]|nr:transporter [Desulfobacter sp.]